MRTQEAPMQGAAPEQSETKHRNWMPWLIAVVVVLGLVAVGLVIWASEDDASDPLSETIEGVWVTELFGKYEVFLDDGTYGVGNTISSATPVDGEAELDSGTWSVDGDILTRTTDASSLCAPWVGTYEVEVLDDGDRLEITVLEDECELRREDFGSGLTRYAGR